MGKEGRSWLPDDCNQENAGGKGWGADIIPSCKRLFLLLLLL